MAATPLVIAHRGFSARYPENTLAAIRGGIDEGADLVEIDVQNTADGKVVVIHDFLLRRLCALPGRISQVTLQQLRQGKPDVPTLAEALQAVQGKARLLIEMKQADPLQVARDVEDADMVDQVIVFSFSIPKLKALAKTHPAIRRFGLIGDNLPGSVRELIATVDVEGVGVASRLLKSPTDVRRLQRQMGQVFVWTVNSPRRMHELADWNADGLITNYPDRARKLWPRNS